MVVDNALSLNPSAADISITTHGSIWYWTVFSIMIASVVAFSGLSFAAPKGQRIFHYLTTAIVLVTAVSYFTMAADLGSTPIAVEFKDPGLTRQIFYARHIQWFLTTPLILLDLLLLAGLSWSNILFTLFAGDVSVVLILFASLTSSNYKWGYFTMAVGAFGYIIWQVAFIGRSSALLIGADVHRYYFPLGGITLFIFALYYVAFGLSEGGNVITPDSEGAFYGVLDVITTTGFGLYLLLSLRALDFSKLGLTETSRFVTGTHEKIVRQNVPSQETARDAQV